KEVIGKLGSHVVVARMVNGQLDSDLQHVLAEQSHPGGTVSLLHVAAVRKRGAPVEYADVVEPKEAAFENVLSEAVLSIDPPGEIQHQLLERAHQELHVPLAAQCQFFAIEKDRSPGVHRRIYVAEVPFVSRDLSGWMNEELLQQKIELRLREIQINGRDGQSL